MAASDHNRPDTDLLSLQAMPELARALRQRLERIVRLWTDQVDRLLPGADELTKKQVRNTIPIALGHLADALESDQPAQTRTLELISGDHGTSRFHQSYDVKQLVIEYRLLRRIVQEEMADILGSLRLDQLVALDMGIDLILQQSVVAFVEHQRERIEAANQAEHRFLAFVSHDLRNHLNHAVLVLEAHSMRLRDTPGFEEDIADLEAARRSIFQTIQGMERLLQVERLRRETFHPRREHFDLSTLAAQALQALRLEAKAKKLELTCDISAGFTVSSDPELIGLVLQNLVGNAIKFSERGTIHVTAERSPDDGWSLLVADQGPGIAPEQRQHIFEAFSRGTTHGQSGVGLGLAIAAQSARRLGGELTVQSTVGAGSTFRMTIPGMVG